MDNQGIARVFNEISRLLELKGANPFKIRAYRNAAETLADLPGQVSELPTDELLAIPGIGKDLAARIRELCDTGRLGYHAELLTEYPASLLELLELQGLGPKTVARLHTSVGIHTVDGLEQAALAGTLDSLPGLGKKKNKS